MSRGFAPRRGVAQKGSSSLQGCFREQMIMRPVRLGFAPDLSKGRAGQRRTHWLAAVTDRLNELAALPEGWDGKRAPAVAPQACVSAARMLSELAEELVPRPDISPSLDGGLLLEWDRDGVELDIFIEPDGSATVYYEHGERSWDGDWESKREGVRLLLTHLSAPARAAV